MLPTFRPDIHGPDIFFLEKVELYGKSWQPLSDIEIAKLKKQNLEISEEMNKMKLKFETESRVLSDRFQFASNQVTFSPKPLDLL